MKKYQKLVSFTLSMLFPVCLGFQAKALPNPSQDEDFIASTIYKEFTRLRERFQLETPDTVVGGLYKQKSFGSHVVLWKIEQFPEDSEVIRIYRASKIEGEQDFSVTFHKNGVIVPGKTVLRRFIGPDSRGWRNDTLDYLTFQYLGSQGAERPQISPTDREILNMWDILEF